MKKKPFHANQARAASQTSSSVVAAASLLVLPMMMVPNRVEAQGAAGPPSISGTKAGPKVGPGTLSLNFSKISVEYSVIGVLGKNTIFKDADGKFFFVKPNGDLEFLVRKAGGEIKGESGYEYLKIKMSDVSLSSKVKILGLNSAGDVVFKFSSGEKFTLNERGDRVLVRP